ncbi:MAG: mechanosensitive ion channel family protein [Betaproteobacteria bacterium]
MKEAPIAELIEALAVGLSRPHQIASLAVIAAAIAIGAIAARWVARRTEARVASASAPADTVPAGRPIDALRFSIEGVRRLAFPLVTQVMLWLGEAGLRIGGIVQSSTDLGLLRIAMTLFAAMAAIRLLVYVLRRVFRGVALLVVWERAIAAAIWLVFALYVTGSLGAVVNWLESTSLPLGKGGVSLWVLLTGLLSIVVTLIGALWLGAALEERLMRMTSVDRNLRAILSRVLRALLVLLAVLVALSLVGIDLTVLSLFGGALGVGLGLGLQRIASNYVSGFIILFDRSLRIGDRITVDRYQGVVTQINTRYTVVRAADGAEAIVPNEMLVAQPVTNHSVADRPARQVVKAAIAFEADLPLALRLMEEAASENARVQATPAPTALLLGFHAEGLELEVGFALQQGTDDERLAALSAVAQAVLARFRAAGITVASRPGRPPSPA